MPFGDLSTSHGEDRHVGVTQDLAGWEAPFFDVFGNDGVAFGQHLLWVVDIGLERFESEAQHADQSGGPAAAVARCPDIVVVHVVGEEGCHCLPIPLKMRSPVVVSDRPVVGVIIGVIVDVIVDVIVGVRVRTVVERVVAHG